MKTLFIMVLTFSMAMSAIVVNGQNITITNASAVDLLDTTQANVEVVKETRKLVKDFSKNNNNIYRSKLNIDLFLTDSLVVVTEVNNVSSKAHKDPETQWLIVVTPQKGKDRVYLDVASDPMDWLTDAVSCLSNATACGVKGKFTHVGSAGDSSPAAIVGRME